MAKKTTKRTERVTRDLPVPTDKDVKGGGFLSGAIGAAVNVTPGTKA